MNEEMTFKMVDETGKEKECEVLFTFESNDTGKTYVTYTDYSKDYQGDLNCYSSYYEGEKLLPVTTERELNFINETLKTITATIKEKYSENE